MAVVVNSSFQCKILRVAHQLRRLKWHKLKAFYSQANLVIDGPTSDRCD
jgi:hypothetical protein